MKKNLLKILFFRDNLRRICFHHTVDLPADDGKYEYDHCKAAGKYRSDRRERSSGITLNESRLYFIVYKYSYWYSYKKT